MIYSFLMNIHKEPTTLAQIMLFNLGINSWKNYCPYYFRQTRNRSKLILSIVYRIKFAIAWELSVSCYKLIVDAVCKALWVDSSHALSINNCDYLFILSSWTQANGSSLALNGNREIYNIGWTQARVIELDAPLNLKHEIAHDKITSEINKLVYKSAVDHLLLWTIEKYSFYASKYNWSVPMRIPSHLRLTITEW